MVCSVIRWPWSSCELGWSRWWPLSSGLNDGLRVAITAQDHQQVRDQGGTLLGVASQSPQSRIFSLLCA